MIALALLRSRWFPWALAAAMLAFLIWKPAPPARVEITEKIVKRVEIRWRSAESATLLPGASITTTRSPDGSEITRFEGPMTFTRSSEGGAMTKETRDITTKISTWRWSVGGAALLSLDPWNGLEVGGYQTDVGYHLFGSIYATAVVQWHDGWFPTMAGLGARAHF
jgi:hypothetical protein